MSQKSKNWGHVTGGFLRKIDFTKLKLSNFLESIGIKFESNQYWRSASLFDGVALRSYLNAWVDSTKIDFSKIVRSSIRRGLNPDVISVILTDLIQTKYWYGYHFDRKKILNKTGSFKIKFIKRKSDLACPI